MNSEKFCGEQTRTEKIVIMYSFSQEEAEAIIEAARIFAERVKIAFEEAAEAISRLASLFDTFKEFEELEKELEEIGREPRARRRRMARSRARAIEQRYRAEIRRLERNRFCRRIYKPP